MELSGKKVAVLVENLYEDLELWYPVYRLREAGADVKLVGPRVDTFKSKHGYPAEADLAADQATAASFDAVIIPGGYAPDVMRRSKPLVDFVRQAVTTDRVVAAICHAGWMLASAGVIKGRRVTGYYSIKDDLVNAGALYEDCKVVRDGNLITSRMPADLPDFCREIVRALAETPVSSR
ncbi:MAG TPA: type 1 glutamine amidotransferase domain-containing protein [Candidatus Eisenbacteria bacterium]|nr:type 1 glutamine amidotransferase domain-containing protein [Candidatus Eisenbacteria bacterium]